MFKPQLSHFLCPKFGNTFLECEDNYFIYPKKPSSKTKVIRIAVADGATESSFSKEWSDILTNSFAGFSVPLKVSFFDQLPSLRNLWQMDAHKNPLPWYAEEKVAKGAFSTFLGVFFDLENKHFECLAIGDCCLFQVRHDEVITMFPLENSSDFNNNPYLISSNSTNNTDISEYLLEFQGFIEQGDIFYLMSDAIANWFMKKSEDNEKPWLLLGEAMKKKKKQNIVTTQIDQLIIDQRQIKSLKNDDVSLIRLELK